MYFILSIKPLKRVHSIALGSSSIAQRHYVTESPYYYKNYILKVQCLIFSQVRWFGIGKSLLCTGFGMLVKQVRLKKLLRAGSLWVIPSFNPCKFTLHADDGFNMFYPSVFPFSFSLSLTGHQEQGLSINTSVEAFQWYSDSTICRNWGDQYSKSWELAACTPFIITKLEEHLRQIFDSCFPKFGIF